MKDTENQIKTAETGAQGVKRDKGGRVVKGSGPLNPKGRPRSGVNVFLEQVRTAAIKTALPKLIAAAEDGDIEASKILLMAGLPKVKAITPLEPIDLPAGEDAAGKVQAVLSLIEKGALTMEHAEILFTGIETLLRAHDQEELRSRIARLEGRQDGDKFGVLVTPGILTDPEWLKTVATWEHDDHAQSRDNPTH